jgi:hypothetical protein
MSKFEFMINLKTPKVLGLAVPQCCSLAPTKSSNSGAICCDANWLLLAQSGHKRPR